MIFVEKEEQTCVSKVLHDKILPGIELTPRNISHVTRIVTTGCPIVKSEVNVQHETNETARVIM